METKDAKVSSWQEITGEFISSAKQLDLGELLKCENFTLLEAMSAIELMDPKMDSGMMLKKTNRKILNLEQSIRNGSVKVNNLELDELIGIIDETYSYLVTWLSGYCLSTTVMTNLYLHDPERIEDKCLRVFSLSALKLVFFIDELIQMVYCFEEEDFFPNVQKFYLANNTGDQRVLSSLEDVCQHYERLLGSKQTSSNHNLNHNSNNDRKKTAQEENSTETQSNFDKNKLNALVIRLRFTYNFYAAFLHIHRSICNGQFHLETQTDAQYQKKVKLVQNAVQQCDQNLEKCLKYTDKWKDTIDLGIKPVPNSDDTTGGEQSTIMGFEPLINHKLLPPAYPRCPSILSRLSTVEYLRNLVLKLRKCLSLHNSFTSLSLVKSMDLIENFSKYFQPSSCVVSRSLLQCLYLPNRFTVKFEEELEQSISEFCEPLATMMRKDVMPSSALQDFITESSKAFSQTISIYGHNTARQHERLPELILMYKNLQYSAILINGAFKNSVTYSWITRQLARLCIKYVLSGLELELYSPHEYSYVFWYLYDNLYRNEREQLEIARQAVIESQLVADENQKKVKTKKQRKKSSHNTTFHDSGLLNNDAYRFMTGGLFLLTYGLKLQGKIKTPLMDFTSEEVCFEHRFSALTGTSAYQSYRQTVGRLEKLEYIYREALDCFSEAKVLFEALGRHEDCLKVCKINMVVAKILSSNLDSVNEREVEFCFDTHPSFPTVKV